MKIAYLNPSETGKIYLEVIDVFRGQVNNFQDQDGVIKEVLRHIALGGNYKVREGVVVILEGAVAEMDYGKRYVGKTSVQIGDDKLEIDVTKEDSEYERFKPSRRTVEMSIGRAFKLKDRPIGEINIFGVIGEKKYQDAEPEKIQNVGVKLRIFLWE